MYKYLVLTLILVGCQDTQVLVTAPSPNTTVNTGSGSDTVDDGTDPGNPPGMIQLVPPSPQSVQVGKQLNIQVIVTNSLGREIPSENLSVFIDDKTKLRLSQVDARTVQFEGLAVGETAVLISASGFQTQTQVTVIP